MQDSCDYSEYNAIRSEISFRIQLVNTQENTALLTVVGFWAASFTLYAVFMNKLIMPYNYFILILACITLLFIPTVLLLPISVKSGENLYQIMSLAAYIKVFYEYRSYRCGELQKGIFHWEIANYLTSILYNYRFNKPNKIILFLLNSSYALISAISTVMLAFGFCYIYTSYRKALEAHDFINFFLFLSIAYLFISFITTIAIFLLSYVYRNGVKPMKKVLRQYVFQAISLGIIPDDGVENIVNKICTGYRT